MTQLDIGRLRISTILVLYNQRNEIQLDPDYQREGGIWGLDKRQLLIDSLINGYDVPKIYFHEFSPPKVVGGRKYRFAIIDGKQRLQSIWAFIDGEFSLADSFEYQKDPDARLSGLSYAELGKKYPDLKAEFDAFPLDVVTIRTGDVEQIEEMFSRLNEAVPLNAAEKRNAFGGPLPQIIRDLTKTQFFKCLPFSNSRFRHFDLATKFLYLENRGEPADTKKAYLDSFVKRFAAGHAQKNQARSKKLFDATKNVLAHMVGVFSDADPLLRSVGMATTYYLLFREFKEEGRTDALKRVHFSNFERIRRQNRLVAEEDVTKAKYELLEFDRLTQSPNDTEAMRYRLKILREFLSDPTKFSFPPNSPKKLRIKIAR